MKYMHPLSNYYASSWKQMKTQNETFGTFQRAIETLWPVTFWYLRQRTKTFEQHSRGESWVCLFVNVRNEYHINHLERKVMIVMMIRTCTKSKYVIWSAHKDDNDDPDKIPNHYLTFCPCPCLCPCFAVELMVKALLSH